MTTVARHMPDNMTEWICQVKLHQEKHQDVFLRDVSCPNELMLVEDSTSCADVMIKWETMRISLVEVLALYA